MLNKYISMFYGTAALVFSCFVCDAKADNFNCEVTVKQTIKKGNKITYKEESVKVEADDVEQAEKKAVDSVNHKMKTLFTPNPSIDFKAIGAECKKESE